MTPAAPTRLPHGQSDIRAMTERCRQVTGLNLGQGLCQVEPPPELMKAAARRIATCSHTYSPAEGLHEFRKAAAAKIARYQHLDIDTSDGIVATIGATGAFAAALLGLLEPGDDVLLIEPFYGYHLDTLRAFGLLPRIIELDDTFTLTSEAVDAAITDNCRAIVVCTPANPSGRRYTRTELDLITAAAAKHDLLVITDEVYEHIYFGAEPHLSPAALDGLFDRTVSITSLSKTFSVPGWRLGYAYGPAELIGRVRLAADTLVVCPPTPLQQIAAEILTIDDSFYVSLRRDYQRRLRVLTEAFELNGCAVLQPEGGYYALIDLSAHGARTGQEAADLLMDKCRIATIPLESFQLKGRTRPLVRACFSLPDSDLDTLSTRLADLRQR